MKRLLLDQLVHKMQKKFYKNVKTALGIQVRAEAVKTDVNPK